MFRPLAAALIAIAGVSLPAAVLAQDYSQIRAMMQPGTDVYGSSGKVVGTIESVGDKTFVLKTPDGPLTLSRGVVSLGVKGLRIDKTQSQVARMVGAQGAQTPG